MPNRTKLQESVKRIKADRKMGERYMIFEEMLREERIQGKAEGKAEAVLEMLKDLGELPEGLCEKIMAEKDQQRLSVLLKAAAGADSIVTFIKNINFN